MSPCALGTLIQIVAGAPAVTGALVLTEVISGGVSATVTFTMDVAPTAPSSSAT